MSGDDPSDPARQLHRHRLRFQGRDDEFERQCKAELEAEDGRAWDELQAEIVAERTPDGLGIKFALKPAGPVPDNVVPLRKK